MIRMALDCEHYDNDEVMAALGRQVVDQYIGFWKQRDSDPFENLMGPASYIIGSIAEYVEEVDEGDRKDCDDCKWHRYPVGLVQGTNTLCHCAIGQPEHADCCRQLREDLDEDEPTEDASETCPNFSEEE